VISCTPSPLSNHTAAPGAGIRFDRVSKTYGGKVVVDDVTFEVPAGACVVIVGPSGCGKTTLLKTVNRLIEPTSGRVYVDGRDVSTLDPSLLRRGIGYVIQQVGLFPHMTVDANVGVVPSLAGWPRERIEARIREMLELVGLDPAVFGRRFPAQLSGGQQQRVGLARALAADPDILLMDEPFGALDAIERSRLQGELAALQARLHKTILFVTHDVDEALRLADRIVVMRDGRVVQDDPPLRLLARPADAFVAELVNAADLVRRLSVMRVRDVALGPPDGAPTGDALGLDDDLRGALSRMLATGNFSLRVRDGSGTVTGTLTLERMLEAARLAGG
jgi:osmoprotectant transport system ATP-binding protein